LVTLIAGIFGFIIASIPFTIQLLEIKNNENIAILNRNKVMRRKLFNKYFDVLKSSFWLFVFILILNLLKIAYDNKMYIDLNCIYFKVFLFLMYVSLIFIYTRLAYKFLRELYRLINILYNLIEAYLKGKED